MMKVSTGAALAVLPLLLPTDDELMLNVLRCHLTYQGQVVTNAEARFNKSHIRKVTCMRV